MFTLLDMQKEKQCTSIILILESDFICSLIKIMTTVTNKLD